MALFLEEAEEILDTASNALDQWEQGDSSNVDSLQRDLHTLKGGARMAGVAPVGDLAHELENLYEGYNGGQLDANGDLFALLHRCHDSLADMIDALRANRSPQDAPALVSAIQAYIKGEPAADITPTAVSPAEQSAPEPEPVSPEPVAVEDAPDSEAPPQPERDPELVEIFLEEADEILESAGNSLELWIGDRVQRRLNALCLRSEVGMVHQREGVRAAACF